MKKHYQNNWKWPIILSFQLLAVFIAYSSLIAETVLLINFDEDFNPVFTKSQKKEAVISPKNQEGSLQSVPGKFKKGLFVRRFTGGHALNYDIKRCMDGKGGTVEFWFKPDWDCKTILQKGEGQKWLQGRPITTTFCTTSEEGSGIAFRKNQYNVLSFYVYRNYRPICNVQIPASLVFKKNEWVHLTVAWDQEEARIFSNGKLLATSNEWNLNYFRSFIGVGSRTDGSGVFDEFRLSNNKRYVSSFPVPEKPYPIPEKKKKQRETNEKDKKATLSLDQINKLKVEKVIFFTDFSDGLNAQYAEGNPAGWSNRKLEIKKLDDKNYIAVYRHNKNVGDTLCYEVKNNLNRDLGTVEIKLKLQKDFSLPLVLFDSCHVLSWKGSRTGMRLIINKDSGLEWQCLNQNSVLSKVTSKPVKLVPDKDYTFGFSWANSSIDIYENGKKIASGTECAIPARLGRYFFIGSDNLGRNSLNGWLETVKVYLKKM